MKRVAINETGFAVANDNEVHLGGGNLMRPDPSQEAVILETVRKRESGKCIIS